MSTENRAHNPIVYIALVGLALAVLCGGWFTYSALTSRHAAQSERNEVVANSTPPCN